MAMGKLKFVCILGLTAHNHYGCMGMRESLLCG